MPETIKEATQELKPEAHQWVESYGMEWPPSHPGKRSNTSTIHEMICLDQAYTQLTQSARRKRCQRHSTRHSRFLPQVMQQRHRQLS
jgi:hypothetical protein